jgi:hypothetical protein
VTALSSRVPPVQQWRHWEASGADLVCLLQETVQDVSDEMARLAAWRKAEEEAEAKEKAQEEEDIALAAGDVMAEACLRDDRLAANFLKQRFLKEAGRAGAQLGRSVPHPNATTLTSPVSDTAAPHSTMSPPQEQ